jgi:hypothetical protein
VRHSWRLDHPERLEPHVRPDAGEDPRAAAKDMGATWSSISSTSPAARYGLMMSAPPPMKMSLSPAASRACASADWMPSVTKVKVVSESLSGSRSWCVTTKTHLWNGGS